MTSKFDPRDYPLALRTPHRLTSMSFWHMHIPFAFALIQMLRPGLYVELGTHKGDSYCAVCQAVDTLGLDTRCYAVDTWAGDIHTGQYEDAIFDELKAYHDPRYGRFSTLIRSLFEGALDHFEDGSIDLLHIDGTHTYEAVRHDFESWLPKMSERGVVMMHDIAEHRPNYGVWRLWDELKERYPYFEFLYGHGLGVVAVGSEIPESMNPFFTDESHAPLTAHYFSMLGERVQELGKAREAERRGRSRGATVPAEEREPVISPESSPDKADDASHDSRLSPRLLAFYLPQFHPIPENDLWRGKGFTEWTNVAQAKPLFPGHYQPRLPADLGFYDLRLPETRQAQADLARAYGISGFCYYHYWFKGRRILERPLDEMLASGHPNFPFCLCWANHTWTLKWNSEKPGRLIEQEYSEEDDRNHIRWLLNVFQDERYIKIDDRPLVLIYRAQSLPNPLQTVTTWKEEARRVGQPEPYVCKVETFGDFTDPREFGFDAAVEFPPQKLDAPFERVFGPDETYHVNKVYEYEDRVARHLGRPAPPYLRFPCVVPSWDNTPRHRSGGAQILQGSTPELYERWLEGAIKKVSSNRPEEQIIFINAWNEWAEGTYLEPDLEHGRAYLEATARALRTRGVQLPTQIAVGGESERTAQMAPVALSTEERYRHLLDKYMELQRTLAERLRADEDAAIPSHLREHYEELEARHRRLRGRHQELVKRLKESQRRGESPTAAQAKQGSREVDKLVGWMQQLDTDISALLGSRRWKMAEVLSETRRRVLRKPHTPTASDQLLKVLNEFRTWQKKRSRTKERTNNKV